MDMYQIQLATMMFYTEALKTAAVTTLTSSRHVIHLI